MEPSSTSHFLSAGIKFSNNSCNEIGLPFFCVNHMNVDIKIRSKEKSSTPICAFDDFYRLGYLKDSNAEAHSVDAGIS